MQRGNHMPTNTSKITIFTDEHYKITISAYKSAKKELDLTNKAEIGICMPQYIYNKLIQPCEDINENDIEVDEIEKEEREKKFQEAKAHMFITNFEQILSTSLKKNTSDNYKSLQSSKDKHYLKINLTIELAELFSEYTKLLKELYKDVLYIDSKKKRPKYSDTMISSQIYAINEFLGINEFPDHIFNNLIKYEFPEYTHIVDEDPVDEDYETLYNNYCETYGLHEEYDEIIDVIISDDTPIPQNSEDSSNIEVLEELEERYWKIYNHNFQQKMYSVLICKLEPSFIRLDENEIKESQTHTSNNEELILFVTPTTYKWLNIFKREFSLSINEISYYFIYVRLKKLVEYMKNDLKNKSNDELYDIIEKKHYNSDSELYADEEFLRPYLFRRNILTKYKNASLYRTYKDIGVILSQTLIDKFYNAFVNYKKKNPKEILPNDYLNFLLKDYFESKND